MYMYVYVCIGVYRYLYIGLSRYVCLGMCTCMYMIVHLCICMWSYVCMCGCMSSKWTAASLKRCRYVAELVAISPTWTDIFMYSFFFKAQYNKCTMIFCTSFGAAHTLISTVTIGIQHLPKTSTSSNPLGFLTAGCPQRSLSLLEVLGCGWPAAPCCSSISPFNVAWKNWLL